jgi:predicted Zn-dependent peptidase
MAGNITGKEGGDLAGKFFSGIREGSPNTKKKTDDAQSAPAEKVVYKDTEQVNLSFAVRTVPIGDKDEMIVRLIASILGGAMSSRLFIRLREREGLAYYVRSTPSFYIDSGYLATEAGVPIGQVKKSLKIIWEEYQRMANESVGAKELRKVKEMIKGKTVLGFESSDNVALWYGRQSIFRKELTNMSDYLKAIDKIDPIEIKRVSKRIFKREKANLALIGPFKKKKGFLDII